MRCAFITFSNFIRFSSRGMKYLNSIFTFLKHTYSRVAKLQFWSEKGNKNIYPIWNSTRISICFDAPIVKKRKMFTSKNTNSFWFPSYLALSFQNVQSVEKTVHFGLHVMAHKTITVRGVVVEYFRKVYIASSSRMIWWKVYYKLHDISRHLEKE